MNNFKSENLNGHLRVTFDDVRSGWEQWVLITGDRHHDNMHTDWDLEKKHLNLAKERNALILDVGDLFCAMQGKYDPRSNMDDIRPEDKGVDYLDRIKEHAFEFYAPYADNWMLLAMGNHETNIENRHHTNLTSNLVSMLNRERSSDVIKRHGPILPGGFGGWIRWQFKIRKTISKSLSWKFHHGSGGGNSPVTRGVIQTNRQAVYLPNADAVINGHTHDSYHVPIAREVLGLDMKVGRSILHFLRTPTYKNEYGDGRKGWWIEKGSPPKPMGCIWARFSYHHEDLVNIDFILAIS